MAATALDQPDHAALVIRQAYGYRAEPLHSTRQPLTKEPDFGVTSVNYDIGELLARAQGPR